MGKSLASRYGISTQQGTESRSGAVEAGLMQSALGMSAAQSIVGQSGAGQSVSRGSVVRMGTAYGNSFAQGMITSKGESSRGKSNPSGDAGQSGGKAARQGSSRSSQGDAAASPQGKSMQLGAGTAFGAGFAQSLTGHGGSSGGSSDGDSNNKGVVIGGMMQRQSVGESEPCLEENKCEPGEGAGPAPAQDSSSSQSSTPADPASPDTTQQAADPAQSSAAPSSAAPSTSSPATDPSSANSSQQDPAAPTNASSGGGSATGTTAPTITSQTVLSAPDGTANTRKTVGSGERVTFTGSASGSWSASSGSPGTSTTNGTTFSWQAPEAAGSSTITLTAGGQSANTTMTVVAPSGINGTKASDDSIASGTQGAGMRIDMVFTPLNVSFGYLQFLEQPGPATNITGYFTSYSASSLYHNPNPSWLNISASNGGIQDHAAFSGYPSPWTAGGWEWVIPNKYRLQGSGGGGIVFHNSTQTFQLEGAPDAGRSTVTKFGETAGPRSPGGTPPSSGGSCFPADARVLTPTGYRPLGELEAGDLILSFGADGSSSARPITRKLSYGEDAIERVAFASGSVLRATGHHTVLTQRGWLRIAELVAGDEVTQQDGSSQMVQAISREQALQPVFNLHTAVEHNFIVEGCVAHNFTNLRRTRTLLHRVFVDPLHLLGQRGHLALAQG